MPSAAKSATLDRHAYVHNRYVQSKVRSEIFGRINFLKLLSDLKVAIGVDECVIIVR